MASPRFDPADYVSVSVTSLDAVTVMEVSGEIDIATRDAIADPLLAHVDMRPPGVVLDLTGIGFMGSAGLVVLIEAHNRSCQCDTSLGIVAPARSPVRRTLEISGLLELLPVYRTIADALGGVINSRKPVAG
jgi:anti-anti-sigma factor